MRSTDAEYHIDQDDLWPRTSEYRYRLYARDDDGLHVLSASSEPGGIGQAIVTLHEDAKEVGRRLADEGQIGVLDVVAGEWIVLPWSRPATR